MKEATCPDHTRYATGARRRFPDWQVMLQILLCSQLFQNPYGSFNSEESGLFCLTG
jgi:hypothetical protein